LWPYERRWPPNLKLSGRRPFYELEEEFKNKRLLTFAGPAAIEAYELADGAGGRFIQSIKSYLAQHPAFFREPACSASCHAPWKILIAAEYSADA